MRQDIAAGPVRGDSDTPASSRSAALRIRGKIIVFGTYMPWAALGLGLILALAAGAMTLKGLKEDSPERPAPSPVPEPSPTI